eukprot:TRINITY_DN14751_c0_g1_i1.p1 TRINITY_DN14751_c0_g1~~TRINITY_DN14751_c0_g1_i1.p1  ORF type:complete len:198 (-),score=36.77 TRINITY_DN14751_c0_g1_i1:276-869(-)
MDQDESNGSELKVVMMGDPGVGKSCVTFRFVANMFVDNHDPTIEDAYKKLITLEDDTTYQMEIIDTSGLEGFNSMKEHYFKKAEGFVFVLSLTERNSFESIVKYIEEAIKYKRIFEKNEDYFPPLIIAANKIDLADYRCVSKEELEDLAKQYNIKAYECSAKNGVNIDVVFHELAKDIVKIRNSKPKKKEKKFCIML